ncbi:MAG: DUF4097 family beta strand repeat-containing protein [Flavobacteriaceae bacterium]|nr:DUF4097 family beta strand repeat-containing protein [Flavobacteriaceae bacterium]
MYKLRKLYVVFCCLLAASAGAQSFNETISKELQFKSRSDDNLVVVDNIFGSIEVEGYNGSTIKIEAEKSINAYNNRALEQGKKEVGVRVEEIDNYIYVFLDTPYSRFNRETGRFSYHENNSRRNYSYTLDFKIKVPYTTNLELKTVNDGNLVVRNVHANEIVVKNINGPITLDNISGKTHANALNRDINISYKTKPLDGSTYESLNGNINIMIKENLNADVSFKTMNGGFYTNLNTAGMKPLSSLDTYKKGRGTKYKLNSKQRFRIGNGGAKLSFDLLNGDATIKM